MAIAPGRYVSGMRYPSPETVTCHGRIRTVTCHGVGRVTGPLHATESRAGIRVTLHATTVASVAFHATRKPAREKEPKAN
jgi:hypothetical protein